MRAGQRVVLLAMLAIAAGCRAPTTILRPGTPPPRLVTAEALSPVNPNPIAFKSLPTTDAAAEFKTQERNYRGLDERTTQCLAAANSSLANLLDEENAKPSVLGAVRCKGTINAAGDDLLRESRRLAAIDARNRAALEALERWCQLADAEGRRQLFAEGIATFDRLRAQAPIFRDAGLPTPTDDDLLRQRAKYLADYESLEAAVALLNHDLTARLKLDPGERLWPVGSFDLTTDQAEPDLTHRADLQLIRTLHQRLSIETLDAVQESMRSYSGLLGGAALPEAISRRELDSRRKQLADLLASREAEALAQARAARGQMDFAANRVALLQTRVESFAAKLATAKAENKLADILSAEADLLRARADVLAAVMEWHQWRIRLKAAQGLLGHECLADDTPPPPVPARPIPVKVERFRFARTK